MASPLVTILRWTGRVLVVAAAYVTVCALFFPEGIAVLEPMVCPDGLALDNERYRPAFARGDGKLEVVCTSATATESAFGRLALVVCRWSRSRSPRSTWPSAARTRTTTHRGPERRVSPRGDRGERPGTVELARPLGGLAGPDEHVVVANSSSSSPSGSSIHGCAMRRGTRTCSGPRGCRTPDPRCRG
jgi:hypothetical protein